MAGVAVAHGPVRREQHAQPVALRQLLNPRLGVGMVPVAVQPPVEEGGAFFTEEVDVSQLGPAVEQRQSPQRLGDRGAADFGRGIDEVQVGNVMQQDRRGGVFHHLQEKR